MTKSKQEKLHVPDSDDFLNMASDFLGLAQEMPYAHKWFIYIFFWSNVTAMAALFLMTYYNSTSVWRYILILGIPFMHYMLAKKMLKINLIKRVNK